jgi:hypothetical protein
MTAARVAVLGAGLQGACIALELAARAVKVDLYERRDACVSAASAQNEGKLHLGFIYANDASLATARRMTAGALSFAPLLRRLIGAELDRVPVSSPFDYVVHRDSLIDLARIEGFYRAVSALHAQTPARPGDYFGSDVRRAPERLTSAQGAAAFDSPLVAAVYRTPEIAIDPQALAAIVRARLAAEPDIGVHTGCRVCAVTRAGTGLTVAFEQAGARHSESYDHVVNALWEDRLAIDAGLGLVPARRWLFRYKYFLRVGGAAGSAEVPSVSIVLGPFGDIVNYRTGALFLSWYPAGMRQVSGELAPPDPGAPASALAAEIRAGVVTGLAPIVPALARLPAAAIAAAQVQGGHIFAWGASDIDDPASELHQRHAIGPQSHGNYHSVDTGKYTMIPLFAKTVAERILAA